MPPSAAPRATAPPGLTLADGGVGVLGFGAGAAIPAPLGLAGLHRLDELLDEAERLAGAGLLRALVVRLESPAEPTPDVELDEVRRLPDREAARVWAAEGQRVLRRVEQLPVPTVAVLRGACGWAGLQLMLACGHRAACDAPDTAIAAPVVGLGVLPAWGGTVRLPRLIGVRATLDVLLAGERLSARRARALGVLDALLPAAALEPAVARFVDAAVQRAGAPGRGRRRPLPARLLEDTAPGRRLVFARAGRQVRARPALRAVVAAGVLRAVADGVALPLEQAFRREAEDFADVLLHAEVQGLLHARALLPEASGDPPPAGTAAPPVRQVAVLGAGLCGAALAYRLARHGLEVRLRDLSRERTARGLRRVKQLFARDVEQRGLDAATAAERLAAIATTTAFGGFGRVDAVVEALPERPEAMEAALREVEEHVRDDCLLLSTSVLVPLATLQPALRRPAQLAGLHLLHAGTPLAEVVAGPQTAPATLAATRALARRLGAEPVQVADRPGRVLWRLLTVYLNEALWLRAGGDAEGEIDAAMHEYGFPLGPFELLGGLGRERVDEIAHGLAAALGPRFRPPPLARAPAPAAGGRRTGRARWRRETARRRLLLALRNEAAWIVGDGVVRDAGTLDRIALLGLGFPRTRGGLLFEADRIGAGTLFEALQELHAHGSERFAPAPLLTHLVERRLGFYDEGAIAAAAAPAGAAAGQAAVEVLT